MTTPHLRIAQVSSYYPPALGGVATVVRDLAEGLAARGHEVHALTAYRTPPGDAPLNTPVKACLNGVHVHRLRALCAVGHASFCPGLPAALRQGDFDVIHVHGMRRPHGELAAHVGRRRGVPVILHVHGGFVARGRLKRAVYTALDCASRRGLLNRFDHYLVLTPSQREHLAHIGIHPSHVSLFPNALSEASFLPGDPVAFLQCHGLEGRRVVLFLGALNAAKRCDLLVQAWPQVLEAHPDAFLVLAGPDGGTAHAVTAQIGRLGLAASCRWIGALHDREKRDALSAAACLALPSDEDAAPMVLLEALAQGVPIVASTAVGTADTLLTHGVGAVFPKGSAVALAAQCVDLLCDGPRRDSIRQRARTVAHTHHRLARNLDALEQLYTRLVETSRHHSPAGGPHPHTPIHTEQTVTKGG